jgi:hypothetical protein
MTKKVKSGENDREIYTFGVITGDEMNDGFKVYKKGEWRRA